MLTWIAAAAAVAAPTDAPTPSTKWVSHWDDATCWLIRSAERPAGAVLSIQRIPGNDAIHISIVDPAWKKSPVPESARLDFVLDPGGGTLPGETWFVPNDPRVRITALDRARVVLSTSDRAIDARLAAATSVSVRVQDADIARATLPTMGKAMAALRSCESDALRAWGMDPETWAALRSGPRPIEDGPPVITANDYPTQLVRAAAGGRVVVRLRVDAIGKVSDCAILQGSGQGLLDRTTCALFRKRARFTPAIDADGETVASDYVTTTTWAVGVSP